ncbi:MAG: hypothetical protein KC476_10030 [Cyanobacteria bacterium HKST-UBA06]|nr:hypothetical protein [Cyanobacteria bacterium HKST-UBA06]
MSSVSRVSSVSSVSHVHPTAGAVPTFAGAVPTFGSTAPEAALPNPAGPRQIRPAIDKLLTNLPQSLQGPAADVVDVVHAVGDQTVAAGRQTVASVASQLPGTDAITGAPSRWLRGAANKAARAAGKVLLGTSLATGGCTVTSAALPTVADQVDIHHDAKNGFKTAAGYSTVGGAATTGGLVSSALGFFGLAALTRRRKS